MISEGSRRFAGRGRRSSSARSTIESKDLVRHSNASRARCTATACRSPSSPHGSALRSTSTAPATIAARYREVDQAFGGYPHRSTTRSRPTRRWASRGCCAASAPPPTPIRAARSTSRCAPASRRRRSSSPASARRMRSSRAPSSLGLRSINAESEGEIERIDAIATARGDTGPRRRARQSGHRRAAATRTSRPAARTTSSASPSPTPARCACACAAGPGVADRRTAQPRRLANHPARAAPARGRSAGRPRRRAARRGRRRSSTSTSAAGSASLTKASACRPRRSTPRACCRSSARPASI